MCWERRDRCFRIAKYIPTANKTTPMMTLTAIPAAITTDIPETGLEGGRVANPRVS